MTVSRIVSALAITAFCLSAVSTSLYADELQDIQSLIKQGNQSLALEKVNAYLIPRPKDAQGRFLKGVILTEQNKNAEAIKIFTALTEDYPELPEPYNNLAVLYAQQQQYDKARQALETAIQTHPSYATAHENLGDIYAKMASQAYDRALQLDKSNTAAQTKLSLIKEIFPVNSRLPRSTARAPAPAKPAPSPTVVASLPFSAPAPTAKPVSATPPASVSVVTPVTTPPGASGASAAPAYPKPEKITAKTPEATLEKPSEKADKPKVEHTAGILSMVDSWAEAWANKDVNAYLRHYASDFKPPKGESRAEWEKSRKERITAPKKIQVSVSAAKVQMKDEHHASVTFRQHYAAGALNTSTTKTLVLVKSGDTWLIQQERIGG